MMRVKPKPLYLTRRGRGTPSPVECVREHYSVNEGYPRTPSLQSHYMQLHHGVPTPSPTGGVSKVPPHHHHNTPSHMDSISYVKGEYTA